MSTWRGQGVVDIKWNNPKAHHSTQYIFTLTTWNFNITTVVCSNSVLKCYHKWIPYLNNLLVLIRNHVIIKHFFRNMFSLCCLRHAFDKTRSIAVLLGDLLTSWRTNWAKTPTAQYLFIIKESCWLFSILSRVNWTRSLLEIYCTCSHTWTPFWLGLVSMALSVISYLPWYHSGNRCPIIWS